jgi:hypothetical protein
MLCVTIVDYDMLCYSIYIMSNQKIDTAKDEIDPGLWLEMKVSAMRKKQKISKWLENAIRNQLKMEDSNEK